MGKTVAPTKKSVLGKGIASLLKANTTAILADDLQNDGQKSFASGVATPENATTMLPIEKIDAGEYQPRKIFKDKAIQELSQSIKENGLIQPLIVTEKNGRFELIAGERRLRASKLAGITHLPVVIKRATDRDKLLMSIIENVQRDDLNCVEEALAYYQLMDSFKLTQEEVAKKIGKERSTIANFLRILKLPRGVVTLLQKEQLAFGHAKVLAAVKDQEMAIRFANGAAADNLSVRELEKLIKKRKRTAKAENETGNENPFNDKIGQYREILEKRTGFHFDIKSKKNGTGTVSIVFNNEAEFNDIFEYLAQR